MFRGRSRIKTGGWTVGHNAGPSKLEERGYIVRAELSALGFTMRSHRVVVADLGYGIDGVLGINFLKRGS